MFETIEILRSRRVAEKIAQEIREKFEKLDWEGNLKIMHVCGTHEYTITHYGLRSLLPEGLEVVSGPGCPVCITPAAYIDLAIDVALSSDRVILATFGDMLRVPGGRRISLMDARARGANVKMVYSPAEATRLARERRDREVVFLAIGFETTAPSIAAEILREPPDNFSIICVHRTIPPAMEALLKLGEIRIAGFINPGHVSTVIGARAYEHISKRYSVPQVICGFEPVDVLLGVRMILDQLLDGRAEVENEYSRSVRYEGNVKAQQVMEEVFERTDGDWRGIGLIEGSGLVLRREFEDYDAIKKFDLEMPQVEDMPPGCSCDKVLRGLIYPWECPLFARICTPQTPVGPCMVSIEGACSIAYKHGLRG